MEGSGRVLFNHIHKLIVVFAKILKVHIRPYAIFTDALATVDAVSSASHQTFKADGPPLVGRLRMLLSIFAPALHYCWLYYKTSTNVVFFSKETCRLSTQAATAQYSK